ncbi:MAG: cardiolipin synthase [Deltaproteobacteria bacterium]|nr:cardiolipin synthase [Deltaproteobacteria bacterium]
MAEPLPSYAMPAKKPAQSHLGLIAALVLVAALAVLLVLDRDSILHGMIAGTIPLTRDNVFDCIRQYGHWLFSLYLLITAGALFLESRNPDRTLAWLLALALLPVVGIALYWVVGPNFRYLADRRRFRLPKPQGISEDFTVGEDLPLAKDTMHLLYRTSGARLVTGRDVVPYYDGAKTFERIKDCLRNARRGILLESYIIENDKLGNEIKDILIERAQSGVFVAVIYDAVGSWHMGKKFLRALRNGGVYAHAFLPVSFPMFRGANYRNHRKIIIVDGERAFMGGMNIGDEYAEMSPKFSYWRDAHLELSGQGVGVLRGIFLADLAACGAGEDLLARAHEATRQAEPFVSQCPDLPAKKCADDETPMQIIASGPDTPWDTIQKAYFSLITRSREKLWLTTPYVVPGGALLEALCMASLSGVDVRLLVPGKADHLIVHWANRDCFDELLRAGVRIFLYDPKGFVHAKTITCDGVILSIGSANLDARSLHINFEVQAFLYDRILAAEAETAFENDMRRSFELTFEAWRRRPKIEKVKESVGKLFSSLL